MRSEMRGEPCRLAEWRPGSPRLGSPVCARFYPPVRAPNWAILPTRTIAALAASGKNRRGASQLQATSPRVTYIKLVRHLLSILSTFAAAYSVGSLSETREVEGPEGSFAGGCQASTSHFIPNTAPRSPPQGGDLRFCTPPVTCRA